MAKRPRRYPHDVVTQDIPSAAMDVAQYETYRFHFNYWVWPGDLHDLCAICYVQGARDGA
jgi:hypothetical protein